MGPAKKFPNANPIMKKEIVSWVVDAEISKSWLILGSPGKNISIANGPNAVKEPNITIKRNDWFSDWYPLFKLTPPLTKIFWMCDKIHFVFIIL